MDLFDKKAKRNIWKYLIQCSLATFTILLILVFLDVLKNTAIIAALGASAFVVFTMPLKYTAGARPLIGGYLVGVVSGISCKLVSEINLMPSLAPTTNIIIFASIAVGGAIFLMVITNTEHPPAAGIAIGLVLNEWTFLTILYIMAGVVFMYIVRRLLRKYLINLI